MTKKSLHHEQREAQLQFRDTPWENSNISAVTYGQTGSGIDNVGQRLKANVIAALLPHEVTAEVTARGTAKPSTHCTLCGDFKRKPGDLINGVCRAAKACADRQSMCDDCGWRTGKHDPEVEH